jgi:transcriptional regulator with XRE-family HTH domain
VDEQPTAHLYEAFGSYVRSQRQLAQLSLRQAAVLARISNPYLSQIEHGLALPSIAVIGTLADALSLSAETLLLQAAGAASPRSAERPSATESAIRQDPRLDDQQKHALLAVLASFVGSPPSATASEPVRAPRTPKPAPGRPAAAGPARPRRRRT